MHRKLLYPTQTDLLNNVAGSDWTGKDPVFLAKHTYCPPSAAVTPDNVRVLVSVSSSPSATLVTVLRDVGTATISKPTSLIQENVIGAFAFAWHEKDIVLLKIPVVSMGDCTIDPGAGKTKTT